MQIIHGPVGLCRFSHHGICHVLSRRLSELQLSEDEALSDIGSFVVVEPSDSIGSIEEASGCCLSTDPFGENHYGDDDFVPSFEWLEHHIPEQCFEIAFMMTDDYFVAVFVPDDPGIDPELLRFCREYS